ncbi:Mitochondrial metalloendopeptidase OMA1 [Colletotrichum chlorophyti]|uniref:Mitochondrial metalloendopeptidase OMA1 n=1 Tax=Colletotrichum chlorophyti TaxID=708187 RepID=A0A1Q8RNH3_9PEZI|nr:Mitochondrial metalloendopeptidase OMA1 [Colletotrichum chlorophyti]
MFSLRALRPAVTRAAYRPSTAHSLNTVPLPFPPPRSRFQLPPRLSASPAADFRLFTRTARRPFASYDPRNPAHREVIHEYNLRTARPLLTEAGFRRFASSRGTHFGIAACFLAAVAFYFYNVQTVPVSGRRRFNCYSEESVIKVSAEQVKRVIYDVQSQGGRFLPSWDPRTQMVARVMRRLIPVSGLESQDWEVYVIDDPHTLNAFVLPGGKVFVHSGILRVTRNEDGLAAVLGHEIAHNLAQHVGERMSSSIGPNILLGSVLLLSGMIPGAIILAQYLGSGLMDLLFTRPMGRKQESEADYIGLMLMAEACYDPREAVEFWRRMDRASKRAQAEEVPEFLSTHPSNEHRIEKCTEWLPKAMEKWEASDCKGTAGFANMFRRALDRGSMIVEF